MTEKKDKKQLVRARMLKTGETYQAALRHVRGQRDRGVAAEPAAAKPAVVDDDAEAYRLVSESMGELDDRLFESRGSGVHAESEVIAMIDGLVRDGVLTVRAAGAVKPQAESILAEYEWLITTGNIDDTGGFFD